MMSIAEAAARLRVSPRTVEREIADDPLHLAHQILDDHTGGGGDTPVQWLAWRSADGTHSNRRGKVSDLECFLYS